MKQIYFGIGTLVLGLAVLMWTTAPVSGGKAGHPAGSGHAPAAHSAAHVGSVHYAARPAPVHAAPAVRPEHVQGERVGGGAYRNPYRDDYFRHFRPGYLPFILGDAQYYGYYDMPPDYQQVVIDGITYFIFDGVYYRAYIIGGQTVYLAIPTQ